MPNINRLLTYIASYAALLAVVAFVGGVIFLS